MTVAIACSGTVTTELAAQGAAVVTGYKLGWITWALLRAFLFKSKYSALVNVAANRGSHPRIHPDPLQRRATSPRRLNSDSPIPPCWKSNARPNATPYASCRVMDAPPRTYRPRRS
jgi:lipid-A-disaccharide synthase